jgi:hypothetical protein
MVARITQTRNTRAVSRRPCSNSANKELRLGETYHLERMINFQCDWKC